jgi:hypothetical protein
MPPLTLATPVPPGDNRGDSHGFLGIQVAAGGEPGVVVMHNRQRAVHKRSYSVTPHRFLRNLIGELICEVT